MRSESITTHQVSIDPRHRPEREGDLIARYRLVKLLGEGSFGRVWSARQTTPIDRSIALKLIKHGMNSPEVTERFAQECRTLALMDHPNIAAILDGGATDEGRPFLAMERVDGAPLLDYVKSSSLSIRDRIELFIPICLAVQHAHQKAILHRDLKPSNILITEIDGNPVPKLIDFGIARILGPSTNCPNRNGYVGTLTYMSPEQAVNAPDVDTRIDVYSLGVILYQLLTGLTPINPGTVAYDEMIRQVQIAEIRKPSHQIRNKGSFERSDKSINGDLDAIVMKALEKDRRRRYETAADLAMDLRSFLADLPVQARAATLNGRALKFFRRNRVAVLTSSIVLGILASSTWFSIRQAIEANKSRSIAEFREAEARTTFDSARSAIDLYLNRVSDNPSMLGANFLSLRRELLESALPFYQELANSTGTDPELRESQARAYANLADLHHSLGDVEHSDENYRKAIGLDKALIQEFPSAPVYRNNLALHCNNFGASLMPESALPHLRTSIECTQWLIDYDPSNTDFQQGLIATLANLGNALHLTNQMTEAEAALNQALASSEKLLTRDPQNASFRSNLATAQTNLASLIGQKNPGSAESLHRKALEILEGLVAEFPEAYNYRGITSTARLNYAALLTRGGNSEEATQQINQAIEANQGLVRNFSTIPYTRMILGDSLIQRGEIQTQLSAFDAAGEDFQAAYELFSALHRSEELVPEYTYKLADLSLRFAHLAKIRQDWQEVQTSSQRAIEYFRQVLDQLPNHPPYQIGLSTALFEHAQACLNRQDIDAGLRATLEFSDWTQDDWRQHEAAAALLAMLISAAEQSSTIDQEALAGKAIEHLRRAIALDYPRMDNFKHDPRFQALQNDPEFQALQPKPPDPVGLSPASFAFFYPFDDPGNRHWLRQENQWTETQPSGVRNQFHVVKRLRVEGVSGTEIQASANPDLVLFVPDLEAEPAPQLRMRSAAGIWQRAGEITDVR